MQNPAERSSFLVLENFIGGKFVPCGSHIESYDPSIGEVYCRVPDSGEQEVGRVSQTAGPVALSGHFPHRWPQMFASLFARVRRVGVCGALCT